MANSCVAFNVLFAIAKLFCLLSLLCTDLDCSRLVGEVGACFSAFFSVSNFCKLVTVVVFIDDHLDMTIPVHHGRTSMVNSCGHVGMIRRTSMVNSYGHVGMIRRTSMVNSYGHVGMIRRTSMVNSFGHVGMIRRTSIVNSYGHVGMIRRTSMVNSYSHVKMIRRASMVNSYGYVGMIRRTSMVNSYGHVGTYVHGEQLWSCRDDQSV